MNKARACGIVAFWVTTLSALPYLLGVWRGEFHPNINSWALWTLIGLVMLLSYRSAGAEENIWVAVVAFTNPLAITFVIVMKRGGWTPPDRLELTAAAVCALALVVWARKHNDERYARTTLMMGILADVCAALPSVRLAWTTPLDEQPLPWIAYCLAMVIAYGSITKKSWDQYALPTYGLALGISMAVPTVIHRIVHGIPFAQWW